MAELDTEAQTIDKDVAARFLDSKGGSTIDDRLRRPLDIVDELGPCNPP